MLVRITSSADPTGLTLPTGVAGAILGAILLAIGIAHYRGYRWWMADPRNVRQHTFVTQYTVLAVGWLGAALLLGVASAPLPSTLGAVAAVLGAICGLVGLVGLCWLPRFLRPRWLLALQTDPRIGAQLERRARSGDKA
ncbi:hypothetical protein [Cellulomonas sp. URHD0024]|uniref:hypothetical protein n=1 Tax=Cellulomonas sp. URHD0024 TaxID=1302620 RepID=UPI0003FFA9DF|nr:hypothetical protein [Cellulomonas sp. URHD0024]